MEQKEIEEIVCAILIHDGPDRHVDGYDIITDFIMSIQSGDEYYWKSKYFERKGIDF